MDMNFSSCNHADEDFIDIEFNSSPTFFCYSISSPPSSREFEFQMSSSSLEHEPITSPADELFYQGKLLPLHLPPRLQMVGKLLQNSSNSTNERKINSFQENLTTPFSITTNTNGIPLESNIKTQVSPCASSEVIGFIDDHPKKPWTKNLKLIKRSALALKLKESRAYLKSLFRKSSGCSDHTCSAQAPKINGEEAIASKVDQECLNKYMKLVANRHPLRQVHRERYQSDNTTASGTGTDEEGMAEDGIMSSGSNRNRRPFSSGAKRMASGIKSSSFSSLSVSSSSSSSSLSGVSSSGFSEVNFLRRSNSTNSEIENAIQGAIAHCKRSAGILIAQKRLYH